VEAVIRTWTLAELGQRLGAEVSGSADLRIIRPVPAGDDDPGGITFAESDKYLAMVESSTVGAVIVPPGWALSKPALFHPHPREAFAMVLALFRRPLALSEGPSPQAAIDPSAEVDPSASIGPMAYIGPRARIGAKSRIHPHAYIGEGCQIGADCEIYPHVVLLQDVVVGDRVVVHAGAVVGADGFGFVWDGQRRVKVPQVGRVILEDDVEVGANTCIDRATCGDTVIRRGSKLDNLIQIGHNCEVGEHTVIAALTGVSGSVRIGDRVTMGGQVAVADHVSIASDAILAGRTGVMGSIETQGEYFGTPATPAREALRLLVKRSAYSPCNGNSPSFWLGSRRSKKNWLVATTSLQDGGRRAHGPVGCARSCRGLPERRSVRPPSSIAPSLRRGPRRRRALGRGSAFRGRVRFP